MARADRTPGIRPRVTLARRLDIASRYALPGGHHSAADAACRGAVCIAGRAAILPAVTFACVFFWSLLRPGAMPPPVVFVVGLLFDLLGYLPLGVGALTLLIVHGLVVHWRQILMRQGFVAAWLTFAGFAAGAAVLGWVATALLMFRLLPVDPVLFETVLAAALYPALAILFVCVDRTAADPERA